MFVYAFLGLSVVYEKMENNIYIYIYTEYE